MPNPNFQAMDGGLNLQPIASSADGDNSFILIRSSEHRKATFRYAGTFVPVAAPTDVLMIRGSASRTLRVKRIAIGGICATAGNMPATLIRRSTQFTTQGSAVFSAVTPSSIDTTDAAATGSVATVGTANVTSVGTPQGNLGQARLYLALVTGVPAPFAWEFATRQDKALILRGLSDFVFLNLSAAALPGATPVVDYEIEIEEDLS